MNKFVRITARISFLKDENMLLFQSKKEMRTIKLEPLLCELLDEFITLKNQVISKEDLIESVWKGNGYVGNEALRKNIYKLRSLIAKIDLQNEISIVTVPKRGYKLVVAEKLANRKSIIRPIKTISYAVASMIIILVLVSLLTDENVDEKYSESEFYQDHEEEEEVIFLSKK